MAVKEKWYGYAGHLIVGKSCAYHLCTRIPGYLISTVGHYLPRSGDGEAMETIGAGKDSFFETYVFRCAGEDKCGNPILRNWSEIDGERWATSTQAENGHYKYLAKYKRKVPVRKAKAA